METELILNGVLLPALVAGGLLGIGWRLWRRGADGPAPASVLALALGAAVGLGYVLRFGTPSMVPPESWQWLFPTAVGAALVETFVRLFKPLPAGAWVLRALLLAACVRGMLRSRFAREWSEPLDAALWWSALVAGALALWWLWDRAVRQRDVREVALGLWAVAAGMAGMLLFAKSARLAEGSGFLAAGMGAFGVAACLRSSSSSQGSAVSVAVPVLVLLGLNGHYLSYQKFSSLLYLLIAAAPLAFAIPGKDWVVRVLRVILVLGAVGYAVFEAYKTYSPSPYG